MNILTFKKSPKRRKMHRQERINTRSDLLVEACDMSEKDVVHD